MIWYTIVMKSQAISDQIGPGVYVLLLQYSVMIYLPKDPES